MVTWIWGDHEKVSYPRGLWLDQWEESNVSTEMTFKAIHTNPRQRGLKEIQSAGRASKTEAGFLEDVSHIECPWERSVRERADKPNSPWPGLQNPCWELEFCVPILQPLCSLHSLSQSAGSLTMPGPTHDSVCHRLEP